MPINPTGFVRLYLVVIVRFVVPVVANHRTTYFLTTFSRWFVSGDSGSYAYILPYLALSIADVLSVFFRC